MLLQFSTLAKVQQQNTDLCITTQRRSVNQKNLDHFCYLNHHVPQSSQALNSQQTQNQAYGSALWRCSNNHASQTKTIQLKNVTQMTSFFGFPTSSDRNTLIHKYSKAIIRSEMLWSFLAPVIEYCILDNTWSIHYLTFWYLNHQAQQQ